MLMQNVYLAVILADSELQVNNIYIYIYWKSPLKTFFGLGIVNVKNLDVLYEFNKSNPI